MNPQPTSSLSPLILHGRIAFATFGPGSVIIDGVLDPEAPQPVDGVFTLNAALPYSAWAVAAAGLVETWAACDSPVELRFRYSRKRQQVRISDGRSFALFDLQSAPSLRVLEDSGTSPPICA
jgi:hypothetical protein